MSERGELFFLDTETVGRVFMVLDPKFEVEDGDLYQIFHCTVHQSVSDLLSFIKNDELERELRNKWAEVFERAAKRLRG